jgi:hypothetical protein
LKNICDDLIINNIYFLNNYFFHLFNSYGIISLVKNIKIIHYIEVSLLTASSCNTTGDGPGGQLAVADAVVAANQAQRRVRAATPAARAARTTQAAHVARRLTHEPAQQAQRRHNNISDHRDLCLYNNGIYCSRKQGLGNIVITNLSNNDENETMEHGNIGDIVTHIGTVACCIL